MKRFLTPATAVATCLATTAALLALTISSPGQAAPPGESARAAVARATTTGQVGRYSFPGTATCGYSSGRLTSISMPAPRAAGRQQWEPTGHWVLWGARLESRTGSGGWRKVGGTHYSDPRVLRAGSLRQLPAVSIPRIYGVDKTRYRVVQTISWYLNNVRRPIVQGQARQVVGRYAIPGGRAGTCEGTRALQLPPPRRIAHDELRQVRVSFAARNAPASTRYRLGRTLPRGLQLNARTGVVTGTISARAADVTATYRRIRSRVFDFRITATANGRSTTRSYSWTVFDTAFVMPNYYNKYGCGAQCQGNPESVPNISHLGPKFAFGCSDEEQPGIPPERTSVIFRQQYQTDTGALRPSAGRTLRYGDVFKWWYYPCA